MKKGIVEASHNSLYTLNEDFDRNTKKVIQEQESSIVEDEFLQAALKESLNTGGNLKKTTNTQNMKISVETIKILNNMGYSIEEALGAYKPGEVGIEGILDRIHKKRNQNSVYTFQF